MGIDWMTCEGCNEPFNDCGDRFDCPDCHLMQCANCTVCVECEEQRSLETDCKYCRLITELRSTILLDHLYELINISLDEIHDICRIKCYCTSPCQICEKPYDVNESKQCLSCDIRYCLECFNKEIWPNKDEIRDSDICHDCQMATESSDE